MKISHHNRADFFLTVINLCAAKLLQQTIVIIEQLKNCSLQMASSPVEYPPSRRDFFVPGNVFCNRLTEITMPDYRSLLIYMCTQPTMQTHHPDACQAAQRNIR